MEKKSIFTKPKLKSFKIALNTIKSRDFKIFGISRKFYEQIKEFDDIPFSPFKIRGSLFLKIKHPSGTIFDLPIECFNIDCLPKSLQKEIKKPKIKRK